jgi:hypothetical protein
VKTLVHWIMQAVHWMGRLKPPGAGFLGGVGHFIAHPHLQHGGDITRSGVFTVGEAGREQVFLPAGAAVRPERTLATMQVPRGGGGRHFPRVLRLEIPVFLDKRQIAEASAEYNLDKIGLAT